MTEKQERIRAIIYISATAVLWSIGGLLIKLIDTNPLAIAGTRSAIAAVVLIAYIRKPKFTWSPAQIGAALGYAGTVILFVAANKYTTAANSILLQFTAPIYVAILAAWFLKERTRAWDWVTIAVVLGGMTLFFIGELDTRGVFGNILAALSGVSFALFTVFMRKQKDGSPLESVLIGNILTAMIGLPFMINAAPPAGDWTWLIILGTVQLGLPYILYSHAIKKLTALESILIPVLEPILNPVWVFIFIGELPKLPVFIGGVVVISAVSIRYAFVQKPKPEDVPAVHE